MRTSDYTMMADLPGSGRVLLVHGYSGAVDVVASEVAAFLREAADGCAHAPEDILPQTAAQLRQRGYLTDKTPEEERDLMCRIADAIHRRDRRYTTFHLIPTYDCQLRCPYCIQAGRDGRDAERGETHMDEATVDAAFRAIEKLQPEDQQRAPITLYGGEPLMPRNLEIVEYMVQRSTEAGYALHATTNGVGLAHYRHLLGAGKIEEIQITLDGPQPIHDQRRIGPDGRGTFAAISDNIALALQAGVDVSLRTNVDRSNLSLIPELARFYREQGWAAHENFHPYCHVVYAPSTARQTLSPVEMMQGLQRLQASHPELSCLRTDFGLRRTVFGLLRQTGLPRLQPSFCGANRAMYLFDPSGDVYACWEAVRTPEGKLGRYVPDLELDDEAVERWRARTVANIPQCRKCPYALLCGGGCAQRAFWETGDLYEPHCADFPELFQRVAPLAYVEWLDRNSDKSAQQLSSTAAA